MLNNEFRLIGTIVSDYEKKGSKDFPKYEASIEVEKKAKGRTSVYKIVVYDTNKSVPTSKSLKGKRVIVSGYLDMYKEYLSLVVQDMIFIGQDVDSITETNELLQDNDDEVDYVQTHSYDDAIELDGNDLKQVVEDLPDDDLPF